LKDGWVPRHRVSPVRLAFALDLEHIEYEVFPGLVDRSGARYGPDQRPRPARHRPRHHAVPIPVSEQRPRGTGCTGRRSMVSGVFSGATPEYDRNRKNHPRERSDRCPGPGREPPQV